MIPQNFSISGIAVIYLGVFLIALISMIVILISRHIMRLKAANRRDPTPPLSQCCSRGFRRQVTARLAQVARMYKNYDPRFSVFGIDEQSSECYRQKALDLVKDLDADLDSMHCPVLRHSRQPLYVFVNQLRIAGTLGAQLDDQTVNAACALYERARRSMQTFSKLEYEELRQLMDTIRETVRRNRDRLSAASAFALTTGGTADDQCRQPLLMADKSGGVPRSATATPDDKQTHF